MTGGHLLDEGFGGYRSHIHNKYEIVDPAAGGCSTSAMPRSIDERALEQVRGDTGMPQKLATYPAIFVLPERTDSTGRSSRWSRPTGPGSTPTDRRSARR